MRQVSLLFTALLCAAGPALGQVTVDLQALDALPRTGTAGKQAPARQAAPKRTQRRAAATTKPLPLPPQPVPDPGAETPSVAAVTPVAPAVTPRPPAVTPPVATPPVATPVVPSPPSPTLPNAPPPNLALAPLAPPPLAQPAPPPPPPISEGAASQASVTDAGLRVTFGAGQTELSPASAAAITSLIRSAAAGEGSSFNVMAYAAGSAEDPSTARRLSLARALAVRSALMADGVSSSRIYVRALGATGGSEAPDRVDLAVLGGNAPPIDAGTKSPSQ